MGAVHSAMQGLRAMQKRMDAALAAAGAARAQNGAARPSRGSRTSVSGHSGRRASTAPRPSTSAATPIAGDRELFASLVPLMQVCLLLVTWKTHFVGRPGACLVLERSCPCRQVPGKIPADPS